MESCKKIKLLTGLLLFLIVGKIYSQNEATEIIPINVAVTENGAATCQIPINVPPGANNVQPNISIVYNSHSRMGNVGWGWHISGISSIIRGAKNQYFDNIIEGIQSNYDDAFYLDGSRMLKIDPHYYGWNNAEYGLENENFLRVIAKEESSTKKKYFEVTDVDGNIMIYEPQINNQVASENHPLEWYLSKVTDPNGNYMSFQYSTIDNEVLLVGIIYSGNESAGIIPYNNVIFNYGTITNSANTTYSAGVSKKQSNFLQEILISCDNKVVRSYKFEYNTEQEVYPFLSKVTEYGKNSTILYPVEITQNPVAVASTSFGHNNKEAQGEVYYYDNTTEYKTLIGGDFNGDKIGDYATLRWGQGKVDIILHMSCSSDLTTFRNVNGFSLSNIYKSHTVADIDNDNSDEIILAIGQVNMDNIAYLYLKWNKCDSVFDTITIMKDEYKYFGFGRDYKVANFDQNINLDFVTVKRNGVTPSESIVYIRRNFCEYPNVITAEQVEKFNGYCEVDAIDYDGDGISELLVITEEKTFVYKYKNNKFIQIATIEDIKTSFISGLKNLHFGDFNGDGITDRLTGTNRSYSINLGTGKGFSDEKYDKIATNIYDDVYLMDVNNDGKTDIIFKEYSINSTAQTYTLYTFLSIGCYNGKHNVKIIYAGSSNKHKIPIESPLCFADFDANGTVDYLYWAENSERKLFVYKAIFKDNNCLKVKEIKESSGIKHTFKYTPIEFNTSFGLYKNHLKYVLNAVEHYTVKTSGNDTIVNMHYKFEESYYDNDKQAFLGFQKTTTNDAITGIQNIDYYKFISAPHQLHLSKAERSLNESKISTIENTYSVLTFTNKRHIVLKEASVSTDHIKGISQHLLVELYGSEYITGYINILGRLKSTTSYLYFHYANVPVDPGSLFEYKHYRGYRYGAVTLPNNKTIAKVIKDSTAWSPGLRLSSPVFMKRVSSYSYSSGNLAQVVTKEEGKTVTIQYSNYNLFGYPCTITTTGGNSTRNEFLQYDSKGRFITQKQNDYNFTENWTYDNSTGQPLTHTDINNNITTYRYDNLGRPVSTRHPDGTHDSIAYEFISSWLFPSFASSVGATYYQKSLRNKVLREIIFFDALGREVLRQNNEHYYIQSKYNRKGLLDSVSEPFPKIQSDKLWTTYQYDEFNRLIAEKGIYKDFSISYLGRYAYYPHGETVQDNLRGTSKTKYYHLDGSIGRITDPIGTIEYKSITRKKENTSINETTIAFNGNTTIIEEDASGNRLLLSDPDAGNIISVYNEFNELTSQTDANGVTSTYSYDLLGRVTQCVMSGAGHNTTMTYSYDENDKKGTLSLEKISPENNSIAYSYDNLSRLIGKTYTNNSQEFSYRYSYNNKGLLDTMVYPYDFTIHHTYDKYDRLKDIRRMDNDPLYLYGARSFSLWGNPSFYRVGINFGTRLYHNHAGMLTAKITGKGYLTMDPTTIGEVVPLSQNASALVENASTMSLRYIDEQPSIEEYDPFTFVLQDSNIQYHTCTYDNRGNLTYRHYNYYQPYTNHQGEWFWYDNMDRMDRGYEVRPCATCTTGFALTGLLHGNHYNKNKMTDSYNTGNYFYNSSKPHAITDVELTDGGAISSLNRCDISYTAFNKVKTITEGEYHYAVKYYPDRQRAMTTLKKNDTILEQKQYVEQTFEVENVSGKKYFYVYAYGQPVAVFTGDETEDLTPYFIHTDHLGSVDVITDIDGNTINKMSFNAWGERRNPNSWYWRANANTSYLIDRGFTGHQHLDVFKLINMNGRIYDPGLGHFLSPDPYVQIPDNPLNFNRYAYTLFNPLKYTDPSGNYITDFDDWIKVGDNYLYYSSAEEAQKKAKEMNGTYLGKTYLDKMTGNYYSLFGDVVKANSVQGELTQRLDDTFIEYAKYLKQYNEWYFSSSFDDEPTQSLTNFGNIKNFKDVTWSSSQNIYDGFKYANSSNVRLYVYGSRMQGTLESLSPMGKKVHGGYMMEGLSLVGYHLKINNKSPGTKIMPISIITFKTETEFNNFLGRFNTLFPNSR
jgi:RHS repeat-associated protein